MILKRLILFLLLLCLSSTAVAFDMAFVVATDTTYANLTFTRKELVDFYKNRFGYTVHVITSTYAASLSTAQWKANYQGAFWSYSASSAIASLRDADVGVVSTNPYAASGLYLAASHDHLASGDAQKYVKDTSAIYPVRYSMDTLYQAWGAGQYPEELIGLASGVRSVWNWPQWKNTDTTIVAIADSGGTLTTGTAAERRAYVGILRDREGYSEKQNISECHFWEMLGNLSAWTFKDTVNSLWEDNNCFASKEEEQACWPEYGASGCKLTYDDPQYALIRFGNDPSVTGHCGDGLTFFKVNPEALAVKIRPGHTTAIACSLKTVKIRTYAIDHPTSGFKIMVRSHEILAAPKWRAPDPTKSGGYGNWVNRFNVVHTSATDSILWSTPSLASGVDYAARVLDSIYFDNTSPVGMTIYPVIPADIVTAWIADSSTNNGVVYVSRTSENDCDSAYCDVEIIFQTVLDQVNDDEATTLGSHVWWVKTQVPPATMPPQKVSCNDTIEISSLYYDAINDDTCYCFSTSSKTVTSSVGVNFNNRHNVLLTSRGVAPDTIIVSQRQAAGINISGTSNTIHLKNLTIRIDSTKDSSNCISMAANTNILIEDCNLEPAGVMGRGLKNDASAYYFAAHVTAVLSDSSFSVSTDYDDSKFTHDGYDYCYFYTGDFAAASKEVWLTHGTTQDTVYLQSKIRLGADTLAVNDSIFVMGARRCGHNISVIGGASKSLVNKFRSRCSHDATLYLLEAGDDSVHTGAGEFFARFWNVNVTTCPHVAIGITGYRTPKVLITLCSLTVDSRNLLYDYVPDPSMCYTNGDAFAIDLGGVGPGSVIDSNVIRSGDTYSGGQGIIIQNAKGISGDSVRLAHNDIDVHQGPSSAHASGFGAGIYWRFVPGNYNTGSEYAVLRDNKIGYTYDTDTATTSIGRSCEAVTLILSGGESQPADSFKYIDITRNQVEVKLSGVDGGNNEVVALGWGANDSATAPFNSKYVKLSGNHWKSPKKVISLANRRGMPGNNLLMIGDTIEATVSYDSTIWFSQYGAWILHSTHNRFRDCVFLDRASDTVKYSNYTESNDSLGLSVQFERTVVVHVVDNSAFHLPILGATVRITDHYGHQRGTGTSDLYGNYSVPVVYKFRGKDLKTTDAYTFTDSLGYNPFTLFAKYGTDSTTVSDLNVGRTVYSDTLTVGTAVGDAHKRRGSERGRGILNRK
jgi:hypothetical protein